MKSIIIFLFQLLQTCSFAQFSLYRNKDFAGLYFNEAENISTDCVNLPQSVRFFAPPGSIKTSQCVVFFNDVDCFGYDSFLAFGDIPDLVKDLKSQRDIPPRAVSYRACKPTDKYLYPIFVVYTKLNPSYTSDDGDQVKKIQVKRGCTQTWVSVGNTMFLSPICIKLYTNTNCHDFDLAAITGTSNMLQPWQLTSIFYPGYVNSLKACDEEDLYKQQKQPTPDDISRMKNDYAYNYTGRSSYGTGGSSVTGGLLIIKLLFWLIGFLCVSGGTVAAVKKKTSRAPASLTSIDAATEVRVAERVALNTVTVEGSPPLPYEKVRTNPPEYKKDIVQ